MGKKAVPVAYLPGNQNRRNTFKKRLVGLMKKVHDLSTLCGAQIAIIVVDESGEISPYTRNESIEEVWAQYSCISNESKARRLLECKQLLETETNKAEVARQAKKDTNQEPQDCASYLQPNWDNNLNVQQNETNKGSTSSTMQYQRNASNAMMSPLGSTLNNGKIQSCITQERISTSGAYLANIVQYGNSNHFFQEQQSHYQETNMYVENQQHGVSNLQHGMENHYNQGVGAHHQNGVYQASEANPQYTSPPSPPIKTDCFQQAGSVILEQKEGSSEESATPSNSSIDLDCHCTMMDDWDCLLF